MLAFGLRVLYAGENLDGPPVPLLPGGRSAYVPHAGGGADRPGPRGDEAMPGLWAACPPERAAALLFRGLRPGRPSETAAGAYAEKAGLTC